jgi:thiol-disulfide isomerase/thioredoxin
MIEDPKRRRIALLAATALVVVAILVIQASGNKSSVPPPPADLPASEAKYASAPDFAGATGWLGTPKNASLDLVALRGHVVLVDFWTYSCINCLHTLPHVTRLYDTYNASGLVVVGVHTPEFGFEKVRSNVAAAMARYGIHYPVAQDNDYGIWDAYANHYWPADYLVDQYGKIRATHFGEGDYAESETKVRDLLREAGHTDLPRPFESGVAEGRQASTPELYAAHGRSTIANPEGYHAGQDVTYARPATIRPDAITLIGPWHDGDDSVTALANASVLVRFTATGANLVADGPTGACVQVLLDGAPIQADRAAPDVRPGQPSCLTMAGSRSYDLYKGPNEGHLLELRVPAGFELFTFDFG